MPDLSAPTSTSTGPPPAPAVPAAPPVLSPAAVALGGGRRIVGVLVTYSWRQEGQIFPVREGRNFLGSDPDCDITLDGDRHLSGRHATVLYRGQGFWIDDEKSMNGTVVNGESVEEKQRLPNHARIQTGSTEWRFVAFDFTDEKPSAF